MRHLLLISIAILALATPTISQTTEAQRMEYEIMRLKAEVYDLSKTVKAYEDVFRRTTEIVKASRDTVLIAKLKAIGYQL